MYIAVSSAKSLTLDVTCLGKSLMDARTRTGTGRTRHNFFIAFFLLFFAKRYRNTVYKIYLPCAENYTLVGFITSNPYSSY